MNQHKMTDTPPEPELKRKLRIIIFGTETPAGRWFDISLIICIILSVALVFLDTVADIRPIPVPG